jgi:ABC-type nitrate/sulfonate/bicarbonate transport system permease component
VRQLGYRITKDMNSSRMNQLLEMARVYRMPKSRVIRYIYIPELLSFFRRKDR